MMTRNNQTERDQLEVIALDQLVPQDQTLRGLKKLSMQAMLAFAAMNLKKLACWTWKGPALAEDKMHNSCSFCS